MKSRVLISLILSLLFVLTINLSQGQEILTEGVNNHFHFGNKASDLNAVTAHADVQGEDVSDNFRVLVYHETNGFRHASIEAGIDMIEMFGIDNGWIVEESQNSDIFNGSNLETTTVVVWLNTSGNNLLTAEEQSAFEQFIQNGGGFVGVHAATDTYRDGSWPWYNDLVGAIVQTNPSHTVNNYNATMDIAGSHSTVAHLGTEWNKNEEYYYWELNGGYLYEGNIELLRVRSTGGQSYDAERPITWYKLYDGGRSFYTALGHNAGDYSEDVNFITMVEEAIHWAGGAILLNSEGNEAESEDRSDNGLSIGANPNPVDDLLTIQSDLKGYWQGRLLSISGTILLEMNAIGNLVIDMSDMHRGMYILQINHEGREKRMKVVKR